MNKSSEATDLPYYEDQGVIYAVFRGLGVDLLDILIMSGCFFVAIIILLLNTLVLQVMYDLKDKREPSDVALISLALADFLAGLLLLYTVFYILSKHVDNIVECAIRTAVLIQLALTSIIHLVLLALERYVKITRPFKYHHIFTVKTMTISSLFVWFLSAMAAIVPAIVWRVDLWNVTNSRMIARPADKLFPKAACNLFFETMHPDYIRLGLAIYYAPIVIILFIYILIYKVARRHASAISAQNTNGDDRYKTTIKFAKTVAILTGLYAFCWAPLALLTILHLSGVLQGYNTLEQDKMLLATLPFGFANSIVNPIVYAIKISAVRRRFLGIYAQVKTRKACRCIFEKSATTPLDSVTYPETATTSA